MNTTVANDTQVGGTHYRTDYQHWDFVADAGFGYFEGQITKYLCRHSKKNGVQDVAKAKHFALKLCELAARSYPPQHTRCSADLVARFLKHNTLTPYSAEAEVVYKLGTWSNVGDLSVILHWISLVEQRYAMSSALIAQSGAEPLAQGYVNQDSKGTA